MYPSDSVVQTAAKELVEYVDDEIKSIQTCKECYTNAYDYPSTSFVIPCNPPHPIVWAKLAKFNCWPVKVMRVKHYEVHVRFFGDHLFADVPIENCYRFSKEAPDKGKCSIELKELFEKAMQVS